MNDRDEPAGGLTPMPTTSPLTRRRMLVGVGAAAMLAGCPSKQNNQPPMIDHAPHPPPHPVAPQVAPQTLLPEPDPPPHPAPSDSTNTPIAPQPAPERAPHPAPQPAPPDARPQSSSLDGAPSLEGTGRSAQQDVRPQLPALLGERDTPLPLKPAAGPTGDAQPLATTK